MLEQANQHSLKDIYNMKEYETDSRSERKNLLSKENEHSRAEFRSRKTSPTIISEKTTLPARKHHLTWQRSSYLRQ